MCGLLGLLTADASAATAVDLVADASHCMRHRGPDESGTWHDDDLVVGFNRLSIIDIEHSHQPLRWGPAESPDRYALVFNGEIYNYVELREQLRDEFDAPMHTEGDSEVIVAAFHYWGPLAVQRLRGMFAFAIWDTAERKLFLARDPFGIKPLFLATGPGGTAFGSEKKSLLELLDRLALGADLDHRALEHYIELQYVPEPESLHTNIGRLESGCYATLSPGQAPAITRYFNPRFDVVPFTAETRQSRYDEITAVLRDSVAKHMRADVTVGSFLSGGIDSTLVAALAHQHNPDLITITTGFERDGYSEIDVAAETAQAIGVRHEIKVVSPQEFIEAIPEIVWYLDDPVADPALVPLYFLAKEARKHVKVVLSGEGADELFGGYTIYKEPLSLSGFDKLPGFARRTAGRISDRIPEGTRGKSLLHRGSMSLEERYYGNARSFDDARLQKVLRDYRPEWTHTDVTAPIYAESAGWDPVARMQHLDLFTWLRGDILVKADKMTMANSLELRVPFLDNEVWRVASALPADEKIAHGTTKYALRKAIEEIIPPHVLHRRKLGFPVPIRLWLAETEMYDWAHQIIADSQTDHLVDKQFVLQMLDEHRAGAVDNSRRIWNVLIFMVWHGIFVEKTIVPVITDRDYPVRL
ncbi:asparagine synthase (glutamine-hydrolyzing) [Gordonia sp. X0973]|uniref:asparagine synthase (glutamine-hydrolyzing) n=1 Tax=Gordonia sp. X0973 TaxID=2742602 RepID=UPI000F543DE3|nr:asparagine synthase (glutamine-hydrolyzing) [Gordonia sp. X0973]QKT07619.1 asparagine synthase (glutamine-hydrolyzing) [Gordonia sp. X0973]